MISSNKIQEKQFFTPTFFGLHFKINFVEVKVLHKERLLNCSQFQGNIKFYLTMLPFLAINAFLFHLVLILKDRDKVGKKKVMFSWFSKVTNNLKESKPLKLHILWNGGNIYCLGRIIQERVVQVLSPTQVKDQLNKREMLVMERNNSKTPW